jgi:transcription elongation factor GreB
VGPDEIYNKKDYVSVNAPIVKACLGKSVGDEVFVRTPEAEKEWEIETIRYGLHPE